MYRHIKNLEVSNNAMTITTNDGKMFSTEFDDNFNEFMMDLNNDNSSYESSNYIITKSTGFLELYDYKNDPESSPLFRIYLPRKMWRKNVRHDIKSNQIFNLNYRKLLRNIHQINVYPLGDICVRDETYERLKIIASIHANETHVPEILLYMNRGVKSFTIKLHNKCVDCGVINND